MRINRIYHATEGEGVHLGTPQIFVRFQGCAVGCVNCDSKETWDFTLGEDLSLEQVLDRVVLASPNPDNPITRVSITGGDPLHPSLQEHVLTLVKALKQKNYFVNIEAAGTVFHQEIFNLVDFISFDIKTPSTGVRTSIKLLQKVIENYPRKLQVKAVVSDRKDFDYCLDVYQKLKAQGVFLKDIQKVITPCYEPGTEFQGQLFEDLFGWNLAEGGPFRIIGQQHKWVYGSSREDV